MRVAVFLGALVTLHGCANLDALSYVPPVREAGSGDGQSEGGLTASCIRCMTGPASPCLADWQRCEADPDCKALIECSLRMGCFEETEISARAVCGTPCFQSLGIPTSGPVITLALPLNLCSLEQCKLDCTGQ